MTRTTHKAHPTPAFPVYCLDWADDETILLGGGGGASRSGISNMLKLCTVSHDGQNVTYKNELKLSNEEDAPMTMALDRKGKKLVTGVNASQSSVESGKNDHARLYSFADDQLSFISGQKTIEAEWSDDYPYQKLTALAPSMDLVAVGTTDNRVAILRHPSLEPVVPAIELKSELVDLDWGGQDGKWLAITTTDSLLIYELSGEKLGAHLKQTIFPPSIDIVPVSFRSARFSPHPSVPTVHAVLNASKAAKRGGPRKAFVATFTLVAGPSKAPHTAEEEKSSPTVSKGKETETEEELGRWDVVLRREVATKPVTVFDVSSDGSLLAYGCSDLSIGILDAKTLAPLLKILHAHSFPPTALKFNPSANLLVSASADNTIRAIVVPPSFAGVSMVLIAFLLAVLMLLLALYIRRG